MADPKIKALLREIRACTVCSTHLEPRPIIQFAAKAKILIIGQAPGARVHESGVPWQDDSGNRLREWMGLSLEEFYDSDLVALLPMGFCYPGAGTSGDLPPRRECAPLWHRRVLTQLHERRLTLLVGSYAHQYYLK